ncbi:MAG: hypothetical protein ACTSO7_15955 [Candidatus Heimdallarchaeota archaeon]
MSVDESLKTKKIVFRNHKKKRGVEFIIYTDMTIEMKTNFLNKTYGLRLPNELFKFIHEPSDSEILNVNICITNESKKSKFENFKTKIVIRKDAYTGKNKKSGIVRSVFLKPTDQKIFSNIKSEMEKNSTIVCIIEKGIRSKNKLNEMIDLRKQTTGMKFELHNFDLIVCGGIRNSTFEVYRNQKNVLYVKSNTFLYDTGNITISAELEKIIPNIFNANYFVCKKDKEQPIVVPIVHRKREEGRQVTEINYPFYTKKKIKTTIIFTHPKFQFSPSIIEDYSFKQTLTGLGYNIKSLHSNFITGQHWDKNLERKMRAMVRKVFLDKKVVVNSEVQIFTNSDENKIGDKHTFDDIILDEENALLIFEYKTSFSSRKHNEIDNAIAEMYHFKRKISGKTIVVMIVNGDLFFKGKTITKNFGLCNDIVLIGKQELEKLFPNPTLLIDRIIDYKKQKHNFQITDEVNTLVESLNDNSENEIIQNNKSIIIEKIPPYFHLSIVPLNHKGTDFEHDVGQILMVQGFEAINNVFFKYFDRRMEIDHLCFKNNEMLLVSCRDASDVNCLMSFRLDIKQKVCKLEYRRFLLNADYAKLYIKVTPEIYDKVKDFEGEWVDSVEIVFIIKE